MQSRVDSNQVSTVTDFTVFEQHPTATLIVEVPRAVEDGARRTGPTDGGDDADSPAAPVLVNANRAARELFRASSTEELLEAFPRLVEGSDLRHFLGPGTGAGSGDAEHRISGVRVDGTRLVASLHISVLQDSSDGNRLLMTLVEIRELESLQRQMDTLSLLPESNPNMVLVMRSLSEVEYVNPSARRWLRENGFDSPEAFQVLLPEECHRGQGPQKPLIDHVVTDRHTEFNGRYYATQVAPMPAYGACMVTIQDVTEVRRIREERDIFHQAFQNTSNAMVITDQSGVIEYVNRAFEEQYGYSRTEAVGKTPSILNPGRETYRDMGIEGPDYDRLFSQLWTSMETEGHFEGEVVNQCASGYLSWMRIILTRLPVIDGAGPKYLGIHVSIDEMLTREREARLQILDTITRTAELRDNDTGLHMKRVGIYSRRLAETLGLTTKFCTDIESFAPFHDIGKVGIDDSVLRAPRKLTPEEYREMQRHTTLGYSILTGAPTLTMAADIALNHHERCDGAGYPHGIGCDSIPVSARIVAVADVYDALRSRRPYKPPWSHEEARREIMAGSGSQFCPDVAQAFDRIADEFEYISREYQD